MSLMAALRRLLGGERPPKAGRWGVELHGYDWPEGDHRWFRQDELVRRCILVNAFFSTMASGFDTVLEASRPGVDVADYRFVKEEIDEFNRRVNLDLTLFIAQVKRSIYGRAGFEIVLRADGSPSRLLPLRSGSLRPRLDESWNLIGFDYQGRRGFYTPDEVLYFVNLPLEADLVGLSDIEPIRAVCKARHELLREDFPEIIRSLWAPYIILRADTRGLSADEVDRVLEELVEVLEAGKSIVVNESVEAQVVPLSPDIRGLVELLDRLDQAIIANFAVPRLLLGRPVENRATAYAELEAYIHGPIAHIRRYLKREVERQWYQRWTRWILGERGLDAENPPVVVKHRWRPLRLRDLYEVMRGVSLLWGRGEGPLAGRLEKVWELLGWDPSELGEEP
ncbi:phage portal protein [Candidatus Bathyarchaeota archaeon]|nr:MAG: phage portal protein [Candidatus Bathyarchaeota archaeon]